MRAWLTHAVGSGDRGMTPLGVDDRGQLRELRTSFYGDIGDWDRTTGHPDSSAMAEAHDYLGKALNEDDARRCLSCHTTEPGASLRGEGPTAADRGLGCERCHGPGGHHLVAVAWKIPDLAIGRPGRLSPGSSLPLCAECHSPRGRSPVPPGDPGETRFQGLTLPRSRCFTQSAGAFGCVTCHNPHHDADTDPSFYESRCLSCHGDAGARPPVGSELPATAERVACPVEPRSGCLDCHMPKLRAAVPHTVFTDHHIRIHRP